MAFTHYSKIKDKICILYEGHCPEYLVQLRLLRRSIEKTIPNVSVTYACRPEYIIHLTGDPNSITREEFFKHKIGFACDIQIIYDATKKEHPVWSMLRDAKVYIERYPVVGSKSHYGIICPEGNFPNSSLTAQQVTHLRSWINSRGFKPLVVGTSMNETRLLIDRRPSAQERKELARNAGFVVGVECDMIYEALEAGIPTGLIQNERQELYEALCEKPLILGV